MKSLITTQGTFGPFKSIEQLADRWVCDSAEFQFTVVGTDATVGEWVAPTPAPTPIQVPQSVSMRQACLALEDAGLLDDVEALVATLPRKHQIEWQRASTVERPNALVEVVRQQKSMTAEDIDALFIAAASL